MHVAPVSEKRAPRMRFSQEASERLYALYKAGVSKPNKQLREELARELGKTPRSIQIWFQNRRAKAKQIYNASTSNSPDASDDEFEGYRKGKNAHLSLNMNALSAQQKAGGQFFTSPYSGAFASHMSNKNARRVSMENLNFRSAQMSPLTGRSQSYNNLAFPIRSPPHSGSTMSPSMMLDNMIIKESSPESAHNSPPYPSPMEIQQYSRSNSIVNSFPSPLMNSYPQSAVEPRPMLSNAIYHEPQSAVPLGDGSSFTYENNQDSYNYGPQSSVIQPATKAKFASSLPDLAEITSDPDKFISWLAN